ncbi:class II myosin [Exophiala xenobiotica]|uniref:Myosin-1 n=1 Tax=Vermiconidia calcicola TaxID=1690605 RepID=A0AAV9QKD7_9PEZI|nr:class II myosin [Exophiala xenobiotica]KAK5532112.1 class II myosin [Chaetothyriales sp. CCFEE 6169]KAK5545389.1 class II myosin [Vermiconidia calcicola]KAK5273918.1 class II myosin [Exophiala xenobiotica]KAK5307854.1 class II myosin [Exophiala xenobiotica]
MGQTKRREGKSSRVPKASLFGGGKSGHADSGQPQIKKAAFEITKKKEVGVSDLTLLSKVSNEAINDNLKKRFEHGEIYTYIGHVLVSVNPFRDLGIYTDQVLDSYRGRNRLEVPPHVFAVAESSYYNMKAYQDNQCVIISGESGAGKTEAAKRLMQYIANVSGGNDTGIQRVKDMVLATNPLLESFGNAKTLRNNNSSRFGKYLELEFNQTGEPVGAKITNYLLESSRVVGQITNERNFHIFYQFTKSAPKEYRDSFGVQQPQAYVYTSRSKCFDVPGIDDASDFKDTLEAMRIIGLAKAEQDNIFRMLAAVLWIGNITFRENDQGGVDISDQSVVDFVAYLLEVESAHVHKALTVRIVETARGGGRRGSIYESPLNPVQAMAVRDALAKAVYFRLFDWIVARTNVSLKAQGAVKNTIGILDIYGFEIFEKNSFEQLCINYVNEKLQQIFIQLTLKAEQDEYAREEIQWTPIKYFDNKVVCSLIEDKRPPGVFAALNDACATAHADSGAADQTFVGRLNFLSSNPNFENRQGQFIIKHYAGDVNYQVAGMTDKNKDQLLKDLLNLVGESSNSFLHELFPNQVNQDDKRRPPTAGDKIKSSANELVETLMQAQPSYIRTIKPNENKSSKEYNEPNVLHQIKYLGLQENVRIRRAGFAYRQAFEKFVERFALLSPRLSYAGEYTYTGDVRTASEIIFKDTSIPPEEYQMGVTKAFIKSPETLFGLEHMRDRYWHNMAVRIQRAWRNYLRYRAEAATRIQRFWRKSKVGVKEIEFRDQGHQLLGGRKERRRYSLLGSRRFFGDYLGLNMPGGQGRVLRDAINLNSQERCVFSSRCELLVAKFGRSSKPLPRILVLTNKSVYIVVQAVVNNQLQISSERTIPVGAVKYISTSNLRDDWFALGVGSPQEPDPLINCVFKTEFFLQFKTVAVGGMNLKVGPTVEYNKKPGKPAAVKVQKDPAIPRDDVYKSGTIHVPQGESPNSGSRPTPRGKAIAKPITSGKLLRPGGPGGQPSKAATRRPVPAARPAAQTPRPVPAPAPTPAATSIHHAVTSHLNGPSSHARNESASSFGRAGPPPPPPPPPPTAAPAAVPSKPQAKAKYDFNSPNDNELNIKAGDVVEILKKETNGWWLCKNIQTHKEGWTPTAYVEEIEQQARAAPPPPPPPPPAAAAPRAVPTPVVANGHTRPSAPPVGAKAKPTPPAPPAKRPAPAARPKPAASPARDSGMSLGTGGSGTDSGRATPNSIGGGSLAGGLAEALRARQSAMSGTRHEKDEDDDW